MQPNIIKQWERDDLIMETFPIGSYQCNCTVFYSKETKEAIIIDPGNDLETLLSYVRARDLKVLKLLHTHAHFDHIGQSGAIKDQLNAKIALHRSDLFLFEALFQQANFFAQPVGPYREVDIFLEEEQEFGLESVGLQKFLKTMHTPGHTPGSCCFYTEYFDGPCLLAGDTLFSQSIGRTDLPGGDSHAIIKSIKDKLMVLPGETSVITGHGPCTAIGIEKKSNPFIC